VPNGNRAINCILLLIALAASPASAEHLSDTNFGFSIDIPDGFASDSRIAASNADFIHAFREKNADGVDNWIIIERMRGLIGRGRLQASQMPRGAKGHLLTAKWQGFVIDTIEVPEQVNGVDVITYNAQVPLSGEAIQLKVFGAADQKEQLRARLDALLATLQGSSNWSQPLPQIARTNRTQLSSSSNYGTVLIVAIIGMIVVGLLVLWLVGRRGPRGSVIGLSILIYVISWTIPSDSSREMRGFTGGLRLLGFMGFLLGLFDLRRTRPSPQGRPPNSTDGINR
jgi:hypothetical protein